MTNKSIDRQAVLKRGIEFLRNLQLQKPFAPVDDKLKLPERKTCRGLQHWVWQYRGLEVSRVSAEMLLLGCGPGWK